jgi:hypothetical protein
VGFTGGTTDDPTYHRPGDHVEAVEVVFDPAQISYGELVEVFLHGHPLDLGGGPRRVGTGVFAHGRAQLEAALEAHRRAGVSTPPVAPAGPFWPAERMHQKFHLQRVLPDLVRELDALVPGDFLETTAAARLNAYLNGFGSADEVREVERELGREPGSLLEGLERARGTRP